MSIKEKILEVIKAQVSPMLQSHGGDISFVSFDDSTGVLSVNLTGACGSCPYAQETLRMTVESAIKAAIPEVTSVVRA